MILYEHPLSPYAQKVKISLYEKGVEFEARLPAGLGAGSKVDVEFLEASPRLEVPALVDDEVRVFDSTVILEYIEDRFPSPSMLPKDAAERARVRMLEEVMDTHFEPINWAISEVRNFERAEGELAEELETRAREQTQGFFGWLEEELGERAWFNGDHFGWGDLSVVPYLNGSLGFGHSPPAGGRLSRWLERVNERPSVAQVRGQAATAAEAMAGVAKLVEQGQFQREYRDHRLEWMIRSGGMSVVLSGIENRSIRFTDFPPSKPES